MRYNKQLRQIPRKNNHDNQQKDRLKGDCVVKVKPLNVEINPTSCFEQVDTLEQTITQDISIECKRCCQKYLRNNDEMENYELDDTMCFNCRAAYIEYSCQTREIRPKLDEINKFQEKRNKELHIIHQNNILETIAQTTLKIRMINAYQL